MADPAPATSFLGGLKPWHLIGATIALISFLGGMYMLTQLDAYRVGELEEKVAGLAEHVKAEDKALEEKIEGQERYVAALEDRERDLLQRVSVLETKMGLK